MAAPIPRVPPVTSATRPESDSSCGTVMTQPPCAPRALPRQSRRAAAARRSQRCSRTCRAPWRGALSPPRTTRATSGSSARCRRRLPATSSCARSGGRDARNRGGPRRRLGAEEVVTGRGLEGEGQFGDDRDDHGREPTPGRPPADVRSPRHGPPCWGFATRATADSSRLPDAAMTMSTRVPSPSYREDDVARSWRSSSSRVTDSSRYRLDGARSTGRTASRSFTPTSRNRGCVQRTSRPRCR